MDSKRASTILRTRPTFLSDTENVEVYSAGYPEFKRALDLAGSAIGVLLFALCYPLIGLAIKLDSHGSILVALDRVSQGKTIRLYKFRSMVSGAANKKPFLQPFNERSDGPFFKMRHDPRLTRVGRLIRKFRIDEVPQFINVMKGELSLVGPRPHEPEEISQYPSEYAFLSRCRGGITGLSQVNGSSALPFMRELELDSYYAKHVSLWLDLRVIGKTIAIFLFDHTAV